MSPLDRFKLIRDSVLLFGGMAGIAHETLSPEPIRLPLLFFFGAMMGLTVPLNIDRWFGGGGK